MRQSSGCQVSGNERPVYTALLAGFQLGILRGARSIQLNSGFIKQNLSYDLKGRTEKFKTQ
jgi:hypothetical protein